MPEFSSFEQQNKAEKPTMEEKLHEEYPELKPRLTFTWPLSERRIEAIKMLNSGTYEPKMVSEFLESSDFVEQRVGMFLIKECSTELKNFSEETYKKIQSVLEKGNFKMGEAAEAKIKLLVEFHGDKALPILEEIIADDKNPEEMFLRKQALCAKIKILAETQGEKALPILEKIFRGNKENLLIGESVIQAFGRIGEKALPLLEDIIRDDAYTWGIKAAATEALSNIGEKALPILERMSEATESERMRAVQVLGCIGEKALPLLEKISKVKNYRIRESVAEALNNIDEKALPLLEKMIENEDVRGTKISEIAAKIKILIKTKDEKSLPILEKMRESDDFHIKSMAEEGINTIKQPSWSEHQKFLRSRKPLFATPYTKELAQRIIKISEISEELRKKFKDKFIGLIIFGSTAKGYFNKADSYHQYKSDLDWVIMAKNKKVSEYFQKKAASLKLCGERYVQVNKESKFDTRSELPYLFLFCGLFFGDRQKLLELQEKTLENKNEKEWDEIRELIAMNELRLEKARQRFNLNQEELKRIEQFALLLRVPPSREEALNAIRSQKQKMSELK